MVDDVVVGREQESSIAFSFFSEVLDPCRTWRWSRSIRNQNTGEGFCLSRFLIADDGFAVVSAHLVQCC